MKKKRNCLATIRYVRGVLIINVIILEQPSIPAHKVISYKQLFYQYPSTNQLVPLASAPKGIFVGAKKYRAIPKLCVPSCGSVSSYYTFKALKTQYSADSRYRFLGNGTRFLLAY
jgi:hypothetical protein